jgi:hypothetical protein
MATEAPPEKPRRKRRMEQQPENGTKNAFAQWAAEHNPDGQIDEKTGVYKSGKYKGKTTLEAQNAMRDLFTAEVKSNPGLIEQWASRASGDMGGGAKAMGHLPENMRGIPNAPDLSGFQQFDKQGRQVSGPSPSARQRFMDSVTQAAGRKASATQAVQDRMKWQMENPGAVADMSIAAKDTQLAQSGITDLGGGTKAMTNKYGTGFATTMTPQEAADRKAGKTFGTIMDERGAVDVKGMMANKGKGTTTPYQPGSTETPYLNLDARDANRADIQSKIAAAIPGAGERRAADRVTATNAVVAQQLPWRTPGASPIIAGPPTPSASPQIPAPNPTAMNVPNITPFPSTKQGLPDDRPSVASVNARTRAFPFAQLVGPPAPGGAPAPTPAAATPTPPPSASVMPASNPNYAIQRGSGVGARAAPPQAAPSPQIQAIKAGAKAVPANVMKGLATSWDGMKRTLIGS